MTMPNGCLIFFPVNECCNVPVRSFSSYTDSRSVRGHKKRRKKEFSIKLGEKHPIRAKKKKKKLTF